MSADQLKNLEIKTKQILKSAGDSILDSWDNIQTISYKDRRDVVTDVDTSIEKTLRDKLGGLLPEAGFIVEEGETNQSTEYNWVIDPIDGTKNFASQMPMFVTQFALVYKNNTLLSQVYNPVSRQFFSASKGNGTTLNDKAVVLSPRVIPNESILEIDFGGKDKYIDKKLTLLSELYNQFYRVRVSGACLYSAYLLTGTIDGFLILDSKIKSVDYLPYHLLFEEAGLKTKTIQIDDEYKIHITTNNNLITDLENLVHNTFNS